MWTKVLGPLKNPIKLHVNPRFVDLIENQYYLEFSEVFYLAVLSADFSIKWAWTHLRNWRGR